MAFETPAHQIPTESVGDKGGDKNVRVEDKPHETARNTFSSV